MLLDAIHENVRIIKINNAYRLNCHNICSLYKSDHAVFGSNGDIFEKFSNPTWNSENALSFENDFLLSGTLNCIKQQQQRSAIVNKLILFQILKFYILLLSRDPVTTILFAMVDLKV